MKRWMALGLVSACIGISSACTRISPGYVGIKVSMAGDDKGVNSAVSTTGWTFYNPGLSSVYEYPTFVQTAVWTHDPKEGAPTNEEITFTNKDQMLIAADVNLSYHLDPTKVPAFYVMFRSDDLSAFTYGYLHNVARDMFNEHAGTYTIEQIMGDNAAFLNGVRESLQARLAPIGVVIDQFGIIGAPRPPKDVIDAINMKVHAQQVAQTKQFELAQVVADMNKEQTKTDTYARNMLRMSEAQAQSNLLVAKSLTPELVQMRLIEKWKGDLPQVNGGSANPFISLQQSK